MKNIHLSHTLPVVFSDRTDLTSQVWLQDITFEKGKHYLIEAASGTGKTSLCSYIYGHRSDYTGKIMFDNTDIATLSKTQWDSIRNNSLSFLFQELRLFPELTAYENVQLKNRLTHHKTPDEIEQLFQLLGIEDRMHTPVANISWGQKQRVALIRSLCQPFDFLMLHEPISHLDEVNANIIAELLHKETEKKNAGIIATSIGKKLNLNYHTVITL